MTIDQRPAWATGEPFLGPVLTATEGDPFSGERPVCASCPVGQWYRTKDGLRCFCTAFRVEMYADGLPIVLTCDAREYNLRETGGSPA